MAKKRIFVIDDEPGITRTVKVNLERTGAYTVGTENHPLHALAAAREFQPDLILLDVMMPEIDGAELAGEIQSDLALQDVPIVFLTAIVSTKETGGKPLESGGRTFVAKPVNLDSLIKCIEENIIKV
ncbi:MAG: response regulator [Phycisphaerae bacterium]|nr:response regulator [Phycisphaerae bacterium]